MSIWPGYEIRYNSTDRYAYYAPKHEAPIKDVLPTRRPFNLDVTDNPTSLASRYQPQYNLGSARPHYDRYIWSRDSYAPFYRTTTIRHTGKDSEHLTPVSVDLHPTQNGKFHNTQDYKSRETIIRRGQKFKVTVTFDKQYNPDTDTVTLQFSTGDAPQETKATLIRVCVSGEPQSGAWGVEVHETNGEDLTLHIEPAPDCIVGKYTIFVETTRRAAAGQSQLVRHRVPSSLIILFNPWCPNDTVYIEKEEERREYTLNDTGRIFTGHSQRVQSRPWFFGQTEGDSLATALLLLERSLLGKQSHGDATLVAKEMAVMSNCGNGTGGVLTGNWSGKYLGGRSPNSWNSSVAILSTFKESGSGVKYGQCWVFAGLLTTLCRALGIPCRCVTVYNSAHDQDYSTTINCHVGKDGRPLLHLDDSVWDFHVWNEVWLGRPDLPEGYSGWHAIDATPHQSGRARMPYGPTPVSAVRKAHLYIGNDTRWIFAQIHGECVSWMVADDGSLTALSSDSNSVGTFICTQGVATEECIDLTNQYKPEKGSAEEKAVLNLASRLCSRKLHCQSRRDTSNDDVRFTFLAEAEENGDVSVCLNSYNTSSELRDCVVYLYMTDRHYTGVCSRELERKKFTLNLKPDQVEVCNWGKTASLYLPYLDEDAGVCVYVMARVLQTDQVFVDKQTTRLKKPRLQLSLEPDQALSSKFKLKATLNNTLGIPIQNGELYVQFPEMTSDKQVAVGRTCRPGKSISETVTLYTGELNGKREIIVCFRNDVIAGVTASLPIFTNTDV